MTSGAAALLAVTASGAGEPLVLLHPFPFDGRMWDEVAAKLGAHARVIVPDLRGFGRSAGAPPTSLDAHADEVARVLDAAGAPRASVAGLSMGGYVALAFARRHPARLARLALVDTRAGSDAPEAREARTRNAELATREGPLAVLEAMMPRMLAPGAPEALRDRLRAIARDQRGEGVAAALLAMRDRPDATPVLATLAGVPSLVVVGEHDATTPPEEARRMAAAIPGAELVVIAGAGHLPCIEAPAELADALARWMRAR